MRLTRNQKTEALALLREWRTSDVPALVTEHEAWRLSDGAVGSKGDHSTPRSLASVAAAKVARGV